MNEFETQLYVLMSIWATAVVALGYVLFRKMYLNEKEGSAYRGVMKVGDEVSSPAKGRIISIDGDDVTIAVVTKRKYVYQKFKL